LRLPLLESTATGLEFLENERAITDESIPTAARFVRELLTMLHKIELEKKLSEIHGDVFGPRWTSENRPYADTSKPANGAEPEQEYLYPAGGCSGKYFF
jgi:hypothetical protein